MFTARSPLAFLTFLLATALASSVLLGTAQAEDVIHLKDGSTIKGTIEEAETLLPTHADLPVRTKYGFSAIPRKDVQRIEWAKRDVDAFDVDSFDTANALRDGSDIQYEKGLEASQRARDDELLAGLHSQIAIAHLEQARSGYSALAERDPSKSEFVERRLSEINSHIFWCSRFGALDDLGLDASGREQQEEAKEDAEREAHERKATEALDAARAFHKENPTKLEDVMERYLDVVEKFPGTDAATDARERISDVQKEMLDSFRKERDRAKQEEEDTGGETDTPSGRGLLDPNLGGDEEEPRDPRGDAGTPDEVRAKILEGLTSEHKADGYVVKAHSRYEDTLAEEIAGQLAACAKIIDGFTGLEAEGDLPVYVLDSQEDFMSFNTGLDSESNRVARMMSSSRGDDKTVIVFGEEHALVCYRTSSLFEELRRASVEQLCKATLEGEAPAFLASGLGDYLFHAQLDRKGKKIVASLPIDEHMQALARATAPLEGRGGWRRRVGVSTGLLPLEELLTSPPDNLDFEGGDLERRVRQEARAGGNRTTLFKAEAWALVHWMLHGKGPGSGIEKFCKELTKGKSVHDAYRSSFARANASGKLDDAFDKWTKKFTDDY